jgi:hypothetical protein
VIGLTFRPSRTEVSGGLRYSFVGDSLTPVVYSRLSRSFISVYNTPFSRF